MFKKIIRRPLCMTSDQFWVLEWAVSGFILGTGDRKKGYICSASLIKIF
jgi:hypothetical protein